MKYRFDLWTYTWKPIRATSIAGLERLLIVTPDDRRELEHMDNYLDTVARDGLLKLRVAV